MPIYNRIVEHWLAQVPRMTQAAKNNHVHLSPRRAWRRQAAHPPSRLVQATGKNDFRRRGEEGLRQQTEILHAGTYQ